MMFVTGTFRTQICYVVKAQAREKKTVQTFRKQEDVQ